MGTEKAWSYKVLKEVGALNPSSALFLSLCKCHQAPFSSGRGGQEPGEWDWLPSDALAWLPLPDSPLPTFGGRLSCASSVGQQPVWLSPPHTDPWHTQWLTRGCARPLTLLEWEWALRLGSQDAGSSAQTPGQGIFAIGSATSCCSLPDKGLGPPLRWHPEVLTACQFVGRGSTWEYGAKRGSQLPKMPQFHQSFSCLRRRKKGHLLPEDQWTSRLLEFLCIWEIFKSPPLVLIPLWYHRMVITDY